MVFKRYIKKGGKLYGPYYYKSFRDKNGIVRKRYIGTSLPKKERLKKFFKRKRVVKSLDGKYVTPLLIERGRTKIKDGVRGVGSAVSKLNKSVKEIQPRVKPVLSFLFVLFFIGLFLMFSMGLVVNSGKLVGKVVGEVEGSNVNLKGNPVSKFTGFIISPIIDESDELVTESYDKEVDLEIKDAPMLAGMPASENKNKRMVFDSSQGKVRLYFDLLNYSEFVMEVAENKGLIDEGIQTGYGTQNSGYGMTGNIIRFFGLVGRVVGITGDLSEGDTTSLQNDSLGDIVSENNISNLTQDLNSSSVGENISNDSVGSILDNVNLIGVKEAVNNLSSEELEVIADNSKIEVEEFKIEVNESKAIEHGVDYKWGYKVKLNDLKFMAKIDVTSDEGITLLDNSSLKIGNKILSFQDLVDSGYDVRIDVPILEIGNFSIVESNITEDVSVVESNVTEITEEINETEVIESNVTDIEVNESDDIEVVINKSEKKIEEEDKKKVEGEKGDKDDGEKGEKTKESKEKKEKDKDDKQTGYGLEKQTGYGILGNVIKAITGFVVNAISLEVQDIKYANSVSVYIERDFTEPNNQDEVSLSDESSKSFSDLEINNISYKNKKNWVKNITPTVKNFSQDHINYSNINYINFSTYEVDREENAALILTVRNRSQKSGLLTRQSGSTPGRIAPLDYLSDNTTQNGNDSITPKSYVANIDNVIQDKVSSSGSGEGRVGDDEQVDGSSQTELGSSDININNNPPVTLPGIDFEDLDLDGRVSVGDIIFLDPSLIIIKITKAEHLDTNRTFISDVYNETKEKDDIWSEIIINNHYVRVTFEQNLTKEKDITVYAKAVDKCDLGESFVTINGTEISCEVYEIKKRVDELKKIFGD